jgi:hypothetical protein
VEVVFNDGHTLVLNFPNQEQDVFIDRLISQKKIYCPLLKEFLTSARLLSPWNVFQETKALNKWYKYKITNFAYLMKLNSVSILCGLLKIDIGKELL